MPVNGDGIRLEAEAGEIARIAIDRPPVNVLSGNDLEKLGQIVSGASSCRVLVLRGLPRAFSAGVEVAEHVPEPAAIARMLGAMRAALTALVETSAVTIAEVSGACLGGGAEIAAACDFVFAAEDARIGFPEIRLACFPPAGSVLLPLRVGSARAGEWILSGSIASGREAGQAGFASRVFPADRLAAETDRAARELAGRGAAALAAGLSILRASRREALAPAGTLERSEEAYRSLAHDPDLARAVVDFRGPRRPK